MKADQDNMSAQMLTLKMQYNGLVEENKRLKGQLQLTEDELLKKDRLMKDMAAQRGVSARNKNANSQVKNASDPVSTLRQKNVMIESLQKQVKGLQRDIERKGRFIFIIAKPLT